MAHQPDLRELRGAVENIAIFRTAAVIYHDDGGDGFFGQGGDQIEERLFGTIGWDDHRETDSLRRHRGGSS